MRVHDRMPVILEENGRGPPIGRARPATGRAAGAYQAEEMTAWRVADDAKNSRIEPHPGMAEPTVEAHLRERMP